MKKHPEVGVFLSEHLGMFNTVHTCYVCSII
jgi:hypothetical protein